MMTRLVTEDATTFLTELKSESIDLIITDPAYASLEKHRAKGTTTRLKVSAGSSNPWFPIVQNDYYPAFFTQCYRALKKNAHMYIYCDDETAYIIKPQAESAGFKYWKRLIWNKLSIGTGYHYRAQCEYILFFEKGKRKLNDLGIPDVLPDNLKEDQYGYVMDAARIRNGYPTEKPVGTSQILISQSSEPGDTVLDPFMGSGSVGEAAFRLGRGFIGCDITDKAHDVAAKRLEKVADSLRQW